VALKALKPRIIDVDPGIVESILREDFSLERRRYAEMMAGEGASP
jgi:hypothetical protein